MIEAVAVNPGKKSGLRKICLRGGRLALDASLRLFALRETSGPLARQVIVPAAQALADLGCLIEELPRVQVWELADARMRILCIGADRRTYQRTLAEIESLLLHAPVERRLLGRIEPWKLPGAVAGWLEGGPGVVIRESGRRRLGRLSTSREFTVPGWVDQVLDFPAEAEEMLAGKARRGIRNRINKLQKAGYRWRFTRRREDFDLFYQRMYLPFACSRHGEKALVTPQDVQWRRYFQKEESGLVLISLEDQPLAGGICRIVDGTCYGVEMGILDADAALIQQGLISLIYWSVGEWGRARGALRYHLGASRPWHSNGPFATKALWGGRVRPKQGPSHLWTILLHDLPGELLERINRCGFISEVNGGYYSVVVKSRGEEGLAASAEAVRLGMDGCLLVSGEGREIVTGDGQDPAVLPVAEHRCPTAGS